ncbi:MAG: hypothetical protein AMJ42_06360 [Deltaproteobacteria bacterium DG_8]|nr:MAG: hypothetical protein AMJ42_06360 [Deltaproteobacteria bacterium DG_8]
MQRIYIFIIIASIILAAYYSSSIKDFFKLADKRSERSSLGQEPLYNDDSYEQLGIELYRVATRLTDLQGKISLLKMAKENREWFRGEDFTQLDELIKSTKEDLKKMEIEYQKTKEIYAKRTVQKMLEEFSKKR